MWSQGLGDFPLAGGEVDGTRRARAGGVLVPQLGGAAVCHGGRTPLVRSEVCK